ncbi:hypothetical protein FPV67DRAFT_314601 [Lyophyllum atratum]|nr:hypothetical protein FPV67DRAFT_314601 [Lyophyllum atratum]
MLNTATYSFQQPLPPTPVSPLQFVQQTPTFGQTLDTLAGVAGGALSTGALSEDGNFMSSFADASSLGIQNGGNNNSQSQAAVQGQPGADYQSFLNSYAQQQPAQPPGVDYQTLIQMQQAQNAQQQQTMLQMNSAPVQTIDATYVDAYNAQLQASQQQYQYQAALDAQAQMNAAAAQEQQAQAMLQAYQQQQQQQLLQLQLQQQQQAAQQQQALQQLLLQQQLQQVQAVYGQQPALPQQAQAPQGTPLVNLLRFGHALSTFASDSGNSVDAGALAGGDGGLMSFFGDFSSDS